MSVRSFYPRKLSKILIRISHISDYVGNKTTPFRRLSTQAFEIIESHKNNQMNIDTLPVADYVETFLRKSLIVLKVPQPNLLHERQSFIKDLRMKIQEFLNSLDYI